MRRSGLDGVYVAKGDRVRFRRVSAPTPAELAGLVQQIGARVGRALQRQGLLVADEDRSYLTLEPGEDGAMETLQGHSVTYRIALGPNAGRKVFTLQTVPVTSAEEDSSSAAKVAGFSLHAGVAAAAHEREKLARLCRYIARPAVSTARLSLTPAGTIRYRLKTPYRDGTTDILFEPLDFIARLAALVPKPRVNLTRFHGVFAPNSHWRAQITPAGRGRRSLRADEAPLASSLSDLTLNFSCLGGSDRQTS